jgi:hypothetical protein
MAAPVAGQAAKEGSETTPVKPHPERIARKSDNTFKQGCQIFIGPNIPKLGKYPK